MKFYQSAYFLGSGLGILLLLLFLLARLVFSLWIAFFLSLIVPIGIFVYLIKKNRIKKAGFIKASFSGGIAFIIIAWIGIKIFPPSVIRDVWDILMPYIRAGYMGVIFSAILNLIGFVFVKQLDNKNEDARL
ncbi:hypothetical protein [Anoxybacteroides tepidamans]|uniref:hypothetical protein n=1 Tax=Anoxybacteroides tepidamans TaxID=265948 RepID=UPI00047FC6B7|nr:hypothetical protein [Anoxybacillus tepidamans]